MNEHTKQQLDKLDKQFYYENFITKAEAKTFLQQALKSQAEMIRAEMVPKHRHLRTDDDDLRIGYNSARSEVKANLDNLINSFK
jgi:hypothetical protein